MRTTSILLLTLFPIFVTVTTHAADCTYDGKKLERRPENFTGLAVCFRSDGKKDEEMQMKNGKREGVFKRYDYKTGKLRTEWIYKNEEVTGLQKEFNPETGKPSYFQIRGKGKNESSYMRWNEDGNLIDFGCGTLAIPGDEKICGRSGLGTPTKLYQSGKKGGVYKLVQYKNLKEHGDQIRYDRDGKVDVKETFKDGESMAYEEFNNPRRMKKERIGDKVHTVIHFPSGKVKEKVVEKDRNLVAKEEFYENGKSKEKRELAGESKNGLWKVETFNDLGELECRFQEREGNGRYQSDLEGVRDCPATASRAGAKENYKNGKLDGEQVYYWAVGKIDQKLLYENGVLKTSWKYDKDGKLVEHFDHEPDGSRKPPAKR